MTIKKTWSDKSKDLQGIYLALPPANLWRLETQAEREGITAGDLARRILTEYTARKEATS